jgi:glutamate racemase
MSLPAIRREFPLPVIGVIQPGVEKAVAVTRNKCLGVIGTESTIRSRAYQNEIFAKDKSFRVVAQACPLFVPLVEEGWYEESVTLEIAERYLAPLKKEGIDTLILGCTHYPLLKRLFSKVMGREVVLVDSAEEVARTVARVLAEKNMEKDKNTPGYRHYFVSDLHEKFIKVGEIFLGERMKGVKEVSLDKFYA